MAPKTYQRMDFLSRILMRLSQVVALKKNWPYIVVFSMLVLSVRTGLFGDGLIPAFANFGLSPSTNGAMANPLLFNLVTGYSESTVPIFQLPYSWSFLIGFQPEVADRLALLSIIVIATTVAVRASMLLCTTFGKSRQTKQSTVLVAGLSALILFNVNTMTSFGLDAFVFYLMFPTSVYFTIRSYRLSTGLDKGWSSIARLSLIFVIGILGDPRYFIWLGIIAVSFILVGLLTGKLRYPSFETSIRILTLVTPLLAFVYLAYEFNPAGSYISPRPLSLAEISQFSSSAQMTALLELLGFPWPGPVVGPFNLILVPSGTIKSITVVGSPALMILPGGIIQSVWIFLLFVPSLLMFLPLLSKRKQVGLLPLYLSLLVAFVIAIGVNAPFQALPMLYVIGGSVPVLGEIWKIAFAIPNYFNQPFAMIVITLDCIATIQILDALHLSSIQGWLKTDGLPASRLSRYGRRTARLKRFMSRRVPYRNCRLITLIIVAITILPAWQVFDGSYSPGASVVTLPGNHVPSLGEYSSVVPPRAWQDIYNLMSTASNGSFSIGWPLAEGYTYTWSPLYTYLAAPGVIANPRFYSYLSELVANSSYDETYTLMNMFGVRYLVVDNTSTISELPLLRLLQGSPGLTMMISDPPTIWVFEVASASNFLATNSPPICGANSIDPLAAASLTSSILNHQLTYFSSNNCSTGVGLELDPKSVTNSTAGLFPPSTVAPKYDLDFKSPSVTTPVYFPADSSDIVIGNNWVLSTFSAGATVSGENGTLSLTTGNQSAHVGGELVVDYLALLFPGRVAIPVPNYNETQVVVQWSFDYLVPSNVTYFNTAVTTNNYALQNNFSASFPLNTNPGWHHAAFNVTIPAGARTFNVQFGALMNGTLELRNISAHYNLLAISQQHPYATSNSVSVVSSGPVNMGSGFAMATKSTIVSPDSGDVQIGNDWVLSTFSAGATVSGENGTLSLTTGNQSAHVGGELVVDYLALLFPGRVAIPVPNYNETQVVVQWSFDYLVPSNVTYFNTAVTTNNYALQNNFSASFPLNTNPGWHHAAFNVTIPAGARTFNVQFGALMNGTAQIGNMTWIYQFDPVAQLLETPSIVLSSSPGNYSIVARVLGSGAISVDGLNLSFYATHPESVTMNFTVQGRETTYISFQRLQVGGFIIVSSATLGNLMLGTFVDAFRGFNQLTDSVTLFSVGLPFLRIPGYSWNVNGGTPIGSDFFGNTLYKLAEMPTITVSIQWGFATNLAVGGVIVGIAVWFIYCLNPSTLKSIVSILHKYHENR